MRKDCFNTLEKKDFEFGNECKFNYDDQCLEFRMDYHFDVDKKFGLNSQNESFRVDLFAEYNPIKESVSLAYCVNTDKECYVGNYTLNTAERKMLIEEMEKAVMVREQKTCRGFYLTEYFKLGNRTGFNLYCDDAGEEIRVINRNDGFVVLYEEDKSFADFLNDNIVCTFYDGSDDFVIRSKNTDEILYDSRSDQVTQEEVNRILHPEQMNRWQTLLGKAVCYIGESESGEDLYDTLHNEIGMSNEEITEIGFTSLSEYFEREEQEGLSMT